MKIEQIIHFDRYSVRKTGDHTGELVRIDGRRYELLCCLGCCMGSRSEEEHVVDILAACRDMGIETLTAGRLWNTVIPSITVTLVDPCGKQRVITEALEVEQLQNYRDHAEFEAMNHPDKAAEELVREYVEKRRSFYQACGVPFPLGAG